jgi:tripartite-type tricarboxylate transporter receptor subunit TctC
VSKKSGSLFVMWCCMTAACWSGMPAAFAQVYPSKAIRIVVPAGPGGSLDIMARMIGQRLAEIFKQPVIVDNRPGASGIIGTAFVAKAPADGYAILIGSSTTHATNVAAYAKLPYDAVKDFAPITNLADTTFLLCVHPSTPARTVKEFIALAKSRPGEVIYASFGQGGIAHFVTESFALAAGIKMLHVPYKSGPDAAKALVAGEAMASFDSLAVMLPHIKSGRVRPIAIGGARRAAAAPDIPTFGEAGIAGYTANVWYAAFAPAGTPAEIVQKLNAEIVGIVQSPEMRAKLEGMGMQVIGSMPEQLVALMRSDIDRYVRVAREAGIRAD